MICFFGDPNKHIYVVQKENPIAEKDQQKLQWLFGGYPLLRKSFIQAELIGPRISMITPWSTNAVEICHNMGLNDIIRIEQFWAKDNIVFDPMIHQRFKELDQHIYDTKKAREAIQEIDDIAAYNLREGLSLSDDEVAYLESLEVRLKRPLTDSEVFGFSQVNSEHCRHKIFNGAFIIDGKAKKESLFELIKKTSKKNNENLVSAYKDNVAFVKGPTLTQFAPQRANKPSYYVKKPFISVLSLKAETHNFPTTVEPFNGAATGSGGEIRDRLAGGQGSIPMAGTAVYMTAYPRTEPNRPWEQLAPRPWLYQNPEDILIKASNGASDFGNKFGQPLIAGSLLTFEHNENNKTIGFDKVIMLAGGIGYGKMQQSLKQTPKKGDKIVVMGGDNYRIGMGGAAVSSADTGAFDSGIELNAVQRSNPEMQKRVANTVRAAVEADENPIISIHDHGAGGHLNCLSELIEEVGGKIALDKLPVGDQTLSAKEIIGNESQERMGLITDAKGLEQLKEIAERERAPIFEVGEVTKNHRFQIKDETTKLSPIDLDLSDFFGKTPKTIMRDSTHATNYAAVPATLAFKEQVAWLLQLEAVACKDWLTNKVDRCVTGRVAQQQCVGPHQLPLANCGVMALDFEGVHGMATSVGHAPLVGLIDAGLGSKNAIAKALTNIIWAPIANGLSNVSLSANWMWACNNPGEDARLYEAVEACADFAIQLGINIPTGKDSLSMKQKYQGEEVLAPGTVIISASGHCNAIDKVVTPELKAKGGAVYFINLSDGKAALGGSAFAQLQQRIGTVAPDVANAKYFKKVFSQVQKEITKGTIAAGHDIGAGGLITSLLEMCFAADGLGMTITPPINDKGAAQTLLSEQVGILVQTAPEVAARLEKKGIGIVKIGTPTETNSLEIKGDGLAWTLDVTTYRKHWFKSSYLLDHKQSGETKSKERFDSFDKTPLKFNFPKNFEGAINPQPTRKIKAAVLREKGSNSEREMAYMMHLAGFEVKDVHMTDLTSGREDLSDVQLLVAVGGFSNSDVLGSAKGWAGTIKYNEKAKQTIEQFFARPDTLSLGVCNGCQLFIELGLLHLTANEKPKMDHNDSGKFECIFTDVVIEESPAIMLNSLQGSRLGIWAAHGEGKFIFPKDKSNYAIAGKYAYDSYPSNPNGSDHNTAMLSSDDGRHLVMMPHLERAIFPWNWGSYPDNRCDEVSPWIMAFEDAYKWILSR
ncbi:MAG: phosphoribosylformylglycinamidine synthase [Flavobacteriaceae bacterium]|nr:phosphoribosylformylglycinamidine synthase [Flavobacteriaceae bacterium]